VVTQLAGKNGLKREIGPWQSKMSGFLPDQYTRGGSMASGGGKARIAQRAYLVRGERKEVAT